MKPDSVARFDGEKAAEYCNNQLERVLKGGFGNPTFWSNLAGAFEAGLVPPEPESKKDMIEIDRAVAKAWLNDGEATYTDTEEALADEIAKALSEGSEK